MVVNITKISQEMKIENLSTIEKQNIEYFLKNKKKMSDYNYKKLFFQKNNDLESSFDEEQKDVLML